MKRLAMGVVAAILAILPPATVSAAADTPVGIATGTTLTWMNESDVVARLDDIKQLGATWVRVEFDWPVIQPQDSSHYHWGNYDTVVAAASARGIKILALLDKTPGWARDPACAAQVPGETQAQFCRPMRSSMFGTFAGAVARHYRGKNIRGFEIWNEPNMVARWKTSNAGTISPDPLAYARLANAAAWQIRRYTWDAAIVTGGLSPLFEPNATTGMRQSDFLAAVLPHLHKAWFTGVGIHPYSWPAMPENPQTYNAFYTVDHGEQAYNLRSIMHLHGWADMQIWATEYGASTIGKISTMTTTSRPDHVTEAAQAQMVRQAIEEWTGKSNSGPIFIHSDSDTWLIDNKNEGGFGLRRADGSKKPAYTAFQQAVTQAGR